MKNPNKRFAILSLAVLLTCLFGAGAMAAYVVADDPIDNGGDARLLGMGRAYTAISDDPDAIFINPAGIGSIKNVQAMGMFYSKMYGTYSVFTGAGALATPIGSFGIGYVGQGTGGIADTRDPSDIKDFGYSDNVLLLSYGGSLGRFFGGWQRLFVGATAKFFTRGYNQSVGDSAQAFNVDVGLKYVSAPWLSFGLAKSNIIPPDMGGGLRWTSGDYEELDSPTRLGVALKGFDGSGVMGIDAIIPSKSEEPVLFALGGEYGIDSHFFVRAGLDENIDADKATRTTFDPSLGLGFKYDFMRLDYAYRPYFSDSSNATHYISICFFDILDTLMKIKIGKVDEDDLKETLLQKYPGKIVDDLGNVIKNNDFYSGTSSKGTGALIPVSSDTIDYAALVAAVFTDLKVKEEEKTEKKYGPGDIVSIIVEAPYDTETITAKMPNGDQVKLIYDEKANAWHGIWRVPDGFAAGTYRADVTSVDFEGNKLEDVSSSFIIETPSSAKVEAPVTPKVEAPTAPEAEPPIAPEAKPAQPEVGIGGPEKEETVGLLVHSPADKTISYTSISYVSGSTGDQVNEVYINGRHTPLPASKEFSGAVSLAPGKNLIVVEANTLALAKARIDRRVLRIAVPEDATEAEIAMIRAKPMEEQAMMTVISSALIGRLLGLNTEIRRSDAAVIFADIKGLDVNSSPAAKPFKDVEVGNWAASAIDTCKSAGLFNGYPDGRFMPEKKISAAEFLAVVLRSEGITVRPGAKKEFWAAGVIEKARELMLIKGIETRTVKGFKKPIVLGECAEALSKTSSGAEKAKDLLDWGRGY